LAAIGGTQTPHEKRKQEALANASISSNFTVFYAEKASSALHLSLRCKGISMASTAAHQSTPSTVDPEEIEKFSRMADEWWDPKGKFRPLHQLNPTRIGYLREHICAHFSKDADSLHALSGVTILDVGCGGGLVSEPLARMGAEVTGLDAAEKNIRIAQTHADAQQLPITYRHGSAEQLAAEGAQYDVVCALEIIEHVADVPMFVQTLAQLVRPGGLLFLSTLNRTPKSYLMAIVGAEYVLRLLPRGTHEWKKFLRPSELQAHLRDAELELIDQRGLVLDPFSRTWKLHTHDLDVNYLQVAKK
jgi:2-polyprenyl-6-hydroxyphenyl methylase/3-demethylubiquinone-9 3-methyltransferase